MKPACLNKWQYQRPWPRTSSRAKVAWLAVITVCYLLSGQALGSRDPLGTSPDWHIYAELSLFLTAVTIAAVVWLIHGVPLRLSRSAWFFLAFGLLALISSARSFWPPLSIVKGCLFCLVLLLAELLCNTFSPATILRMTYWGVVAIFIAGIVMGVSLPNTYPLTVWDDSGRERLALFTSTFGGFAYVTGTGFFMGRLPAVRARWYSQAFLIGLTIAGGSRACAGAALFIWLAVQLFKERDVRRSMAVWAAGAAAVAIGVFVVNSWSAGLGAIFHEGLESFYGRGALEQSPWELSGRVELWNAAAATFGKAVFFGFGFDGARDQLIRAMPWAGEAHNAFLELLLAAGGGGVLCFLAGWTSAIRSILRSQSGWSALPTHLFLVAVAATGPSLTVSQYFGVFLIVCSRYWAHSLSFDENKHLVIKRSHYARYA